MMKQSTSSTIQVLFLIVLATFLITSTSVSATLVNETSLLSLNSRIGSTKQESDTISVTLQINPYSLEFENGWSTITIDDFGYLSQPGAPRLPSKIISIAIPPGAEYSDISYELQNGKMMNLEYPIIPSPLSRVLSDDVPSFDIQQQNIYDENLQTIYQSDESFPSDAIEFVQTAGYRKYNLIDVQVTPFTYRPLSRELIFYPEITITIHYTVSSSPSIIPGDSLPVTEQTAQEIIQNYKQAQSWYSSQPLKETSVETFVIITLDFLQSSVSSLVSWEFIKGRIVKVVTTTWIDTNYEGYDLAEKIRNFLREKYPSEEWGITNVLLVGDYDDVPMRRTWQDVGYGKPETDFYYAELTSSDNDSWDKNGNHRYGETSGDTIDFYSEVNVGRIPWSDASTVQSICQKSVLYEQNNDPSYKKNMLLLGGFFWNDDPNPRTDNAELMEEKINQSWMADWTFTRMYEKNQDCWSIYECDYPLLHENVLAHWPNEKYAFVNWAGHGSPYSSHIYGLGAPPFITSSDCDSLNDNYPAIIFADACSNSDTDELNIGKAMLKQGSVGFVGATKVALGRPGWDDPMDGSTQSLDYFFTTMVTSGEYTQGAALQSALREMYTNHLWSYIRYEMFEWGALWGNPDLGMTPLDVYPVFELRDVSGGFGLKAEIYNNGTASAINFTCTFHIQGGLLNRIDTTTLQQVSELGIHEMVTIESGVLTFINLGKVTITIQALNAQKTYSAFVIGPLILHLTPL